MHCRFLSGSGAHRHCTHPSLAGPQAACSGLLPFPSLHLLMSINKYKYSISRCCCPWKLSLLGMFLLKRLLTGKFGFDKSVFLFLLLINRAYLCASSGLSFFHWKTKQSCTVSVLQMPDPQQGLGSPGTRASHGAWRRRNLKLNARGEAKTPWDKV